MAIYQKVEVQNQPEENIKKETQIWPREKIVKLMDNNLIYL